jgi:hypothetical protein
MLFGIILLVLNGKKILGKLNLASNPISEMLKKVLFGFETALEAPTFPLKPISNVSAPLNTLRIPKEEYPEIPKS